MWCLFCHYLFIMSPSFGGTGRLGFVIVAFPGYDYIIDSRYLDFAYLK